jgi:hypothetical protein
MFQIGIPTLNRADLLLPSLDKYAQDFKETKIHVIDNGNQEIKSYVESKCYDNIIVYEQPKNLGVAGSWNYLCKLIFEVEEFALIINDDVYLGYDYNHVCEVLNTFRNRKILCQSHHNFSVFLINKPMYEFVGDFDEAFYPAYYEDSDYLYRMKLLDTRQEVRSELNPKDALMSQTYEKAPEFVNDSMKLNRQQYINKWGDMPLLERYITPFNKYTL